MVVVLMGPSGSGKTTVGRLLAEELGWAFLEGDDHHPASNVDKMARGEPLTDADRAPWLDTLRDVIDRHLRDGGDAVLTCSALKEVHRRRLGLERPGVAPVLLRGDPELVRRRLEAREGHFFPPGLLDSQLRALEPPGGALLVDVAASPKEIVETIRRRLRV